MFEHFDERARLCVVRAQEETSRLGHAEIGAEHLLLGIACVDDGLVGIEVERLRAAVVALSGVGDGTLEDWSQFAPETKAALEGANEQALALGHTTIEPAHLLLAVLDADGAARRVLRESELIVADVRERATATAGRARPAGRASGAVTPPDGRDVDARLLTLMLVNDTPGGRLLREHGINEAAVRAALGPPDPS